MIVYYSPEYTQVGHDFDTTRKPTWVAESLQADPIPNVILNGPVSVSAQTLRLTHSAAYVNAVMNGQHPSLAESNGFAWDPGMFAAMASSNGGVIAAALDAAMLRKNSGSLSCGLHHARYDHGMGFCTFNGLALAARALNALGKHVLILDLDAHCGGGTYSLIQNLNVVHLDVSVSDFDSYLPSGQSSLDVVNSVDNYFYVLQHRLEALDADDFDVVLFNAGMDVHEDSLGGLVGMNMQMVAAREHFVYDWARKRNVPVAFVLAGGYTSNRLSQAELVLAHRLTIAEAAKDLQP